MPIDAALYVAGLRSFGWPEHFILHELFLPRADAYLHALGFYNGQKYTWPEGMVDTTPHDDYWLGEMKSFLRKLPQCNA